MDRTGEEWIGTEMSGLDRIGPKGKGMVLLSFHI
jgi:hypothetical protein